MHFIGIDIGTSSICGVVYDATQQTTSSVTVANESGIDAEHPWEKIQDPVWIIRCVTKIIKNFELEYTDIKGIGITGQMHGIVYVDENGAAVSPLYTWQDQRGNLSIDSDVTYAAFLSKHSGYHVSTGFGLVTHFYNSKNAIVPQGAVKLCTIMDYAVMQLTGRKTPLMDYTNAAALGFFDMEKKEFDFSSLGNVDIDISILPEIRESATLADYYNQHIPVYSAIGDNQASFIGAVQDKETSIHITIGTSSQLSVYTNDCIKIEGLDTRPFPGGGYILVGAALSGGQSLAVLQTFFESVVRLSNNNNTITDFYEMINAIAYKKDDPTSLSVTTLFNGSRIDSFAKGSISNISAINFTADEMILGFVRGICNEVFHFYNAIPHELKKNNHTLIGSGNAIKKNPLLCKVLEETFQLPVAVSVHDEDAAFGACMAAMRAGK
ncbi:MAG: FGGY family carbohydrate kinase [Agriterribacter sp.]